MSVDETTVRRIAHLARIAVADEDVGPLQGELNAILAFVEQLGAVDVEGVEPMTSVTPMRMKKRADVVNDGGRASDIVANAPRPRTTIFSCRRSSSKVSRHRRSGFSGPSRRRTNARGAGRVGLERA